MADEDTRFLKYRKCDIVIIRSLQESVMNEAAYGLLFRAGQTTGSRIARSARPFKQQYFEAVRRLLVDEGWVKDVQFKDELITVTGSIETEKGRESTCHMLRGVLSKVYEGFFGRIMHCSEIECESGGSVQKCTFKINYSSGAEARGPKKI